jgi:hypothetical protein
MTNMRNDTVDQLRSDIDAGRTKDKIRASDPAMAPLGADEEAAGTPLSPEAISMAREYEQKVKTRHHVPSRRIGYAWILIGFIVALVTLIVFVGLTLRA